MRKKFVFYVLIPLIVVAVVVTVFIDGWVELGLEAAGESAVGARVEIDNLHVTLFPVGIRWSRLQVADPGDPWKNLFETGKVSFALNVGQLLRSKYIIDTAEVSDVILGTRRTSSGALPVEPGRHAESSGGTFTAMAREALDRTVEQTPQFNLEALRGGFKPDSLIKAFDLRTLRHIDSLKQQVLTASKQWDGAVADLESSRKRLQDVETAVRGIDLQQLNSIEKITTAISTVDNSIKTVKDVTQTFNDRKNSLQRDVERVTGMAGTLDDVVKGDFERLKGMARLPELNTTGIARLLVGKEMYDRAMGYLHWVDLARANIKKYTPAQTKVETPPRMKGQDIRFPVERSFPKFWVRKALVSGGTDTASYADLIRVRGEVRNITNDQTVTGIPMTTHLEGIVNQARSMTLTALFDRTKEVPYDEYRATLTGVPLAVFQLGRSDFLPGKVTNARMSMTLTIAVPGNRFDAVSRFDIQGATMAFEGKPRTVAERLAQEVLTGVRDFEIGLRLWTLGTGVDVALSTNLDDQIAARIKQVIGAEITKMQNELRAKLEATVAAKRKELESLIATKRAEVEKQIAAIQAVVSEKIAMVESKKKELSDRLEKEKKGKVKELLKGIIK